MSPTVLAAFLRNSKRGSSFRGAVDDFGPTGPCRHGQVLDHDVSLTKTIREVASGEIQILTVNVLGQVVGFLTEAPGMLLKLKHKS